MWRPHTNADTFLDTGLARRDAGPDGRSDSDHSAPPAGAAPTETRQRASLRKTASAYEALRALMPDTGTNAQAPIPVLGALRIVTINGGSADARVAQLADAQRGLVSRSQLMAAGVSCKQIQVRRQREQLRLVHRGVYATSRGEEPALFWETAALLACREHAALSHLTAVRLWGLLALPVSDDVDVTIVGRHLRGQPGIRVHQSRTLTHRHVGQLRGLPVTGPERALLDSAPLLTKLELGRAFDEALARRLISHTKVSDLLLLHHGHPGHGRLAAMVNQRRSPTVTESEAEQRFLALIVDAGLPAPRTQVELFGFRVDAYWPQARFAVEIDGLQWHNRTRTSFERDRRKQQVLQDHDIEVSRTTWNQITEEGLQLVAHVSRRLAMRMNEEGL